MQHASVKGHNHAGDFL